MNHLQKIILVAGLTGCIITACKKNDDSATTTDTTATVKVTESENAVQDALYTADDSFDGSDDGVTSGRVAACATITYDSTQKTVIVDFGSGCTGVGERTRSGKITIAFEGTRAVSTKRTITYDNYTVVSGTSSYTMSGTISCSFVFTQGSSGYSYSVSGSNINLKLSSGKSFIINNISRTFAYSSGTDKKSLSDDTITITGTSSNTDDTGKATTVTIDSANPILIKGSCMATGIYYPASGSYDVLDGTLKYTVSWGTGTCDKDIQITVLGKTTTKTLP